jgi:hypothetical protein
MPPSSRERATSDRSAFRRAAACLAVALAAPLLVFVAAVGVRAGVVDLDFGFGVLTLKAGWALAWLGAVAAAVAVVVAIRSPRAAALVAAGAVLAAGATLAVFLAHFAGAKDRTAGFDVSTNPADPPGYSDQVRARRAAAGADAAVTAEDCAVAAVPSQVPPGVAAYALQQAGFEVPGFGVGRADGTRTGFWFGRTHDAVVRIRPARTDVRVTARDGRYDDGEACRLAREIVAGLQITP